jgi:glycine oxidase
MAPPTSPEVIVIGAGVIGSACAFELAQAGARVTVFDARRIGQGASQASAGVLAPYIEGHERGPLRELGRRSLDLYDEFIERLAATTGRVVQYARSGTLEIALDGAEASRLQQSVATLAEDGVNARWLDAAALREAEPLAAPDAAGGLLIDLHAFVGVPELTETLAAAAMRCGARVATESRVLSVGAAAGDRVEVITENGASTADRVILAAGSWSGHVPLGGVANAVGVKPVRGQLLHLAWPTEQPLRHVLWSSTCYLVPWLNGRVLVGATVEHAGFDERATSAGVRSLLDASCSLVPRLSDASFVEVRVGLRPASPDDLPVVGESAVVPGLIYATGHYRNGVLLAPLTAALVRQLVFDEPRDPALETLSPTRLGRL